jgi:hypothetical protein
LCSAVNTSLEFMVTLFVTHVQPILDYCSCVWNVGFVEDMHIIESVQKRWTKQLYDYPMWMTMLDIELWICFLFGEGSCELTSLNIRKLSVLTQRVLISAFCFTWLWI